jgi:hypothetical protein
MGSPLKRRLPERYVRRGPIPPFDRSRPVTREEIQELKRQKLLLIDEKGRLLARTSRVAVQNKRGGRPYAHNEQLYDQCERQHRGLCRLVEEQKQEIAE